MRDGTLKASQRAVCRGRRENRQPEQGGRGDPTAAVGGWRLAVGGGAERRAS